MKVFVRSLENTFAVEIPEGAFLSDLQAAIEDVEFIPKHLQRIVKDSEPLAEGSLSEVLAEDDTVTLLMAVNGGMRAKWRKKRMRRLRRKRRKMRMRAR
jgi:ubiquitin-small subunit ribosomal protein S27Ae